MRWIFRLLLLLPLVALGLLALAWALLVHTDAPAHVVTTGFNDENTRLWLEARTARLHGDLMGLRIEDLSLAERTRTQPMVRVERFDASLSALPTDDLVDIDRVEVSGLDIDLDVACLPALQEFAIRKAEPPKPGGPAPSVRFGRLVLTDASFAWRGAASSVEIPDLDLELSGVTGPATDVTLAASLAGATIGAASTAVKLGKLKLDGSLKGSTEGSGELKLDAVALESVEAGAWRIGGLALGETTLTLQGLGGRLVLGALGLRSLTGPDFDLADATLSLDATGGLAGVELTRAALSSPRLSITLDGTAKPTLGLTGSGLEVKLQGSFQVEPAALLPKACAGVTRASGRFLVTGGSKGGLKLDSLTLTMTGADGDHEFTRSGVALTEGAVVRALFSELCSTVGTGAP
jgi:hypothetical protein